MTICSLSFTGTSLSNTKEVQEELCFFCKQPSNETYPLHCVHTFPLGQRVRGCAHLLNNCNLHAKLQQGDVIAQDAIHHDNCLKELYRTANTKQLEGHYTDSEKQLHDIALSEVNPMSVTYFQHNQENSRILFILLS